MRYRSQSGTAVLRDFVEFPSQLMEHWVSAPQTLRRYARHYHSGEAIPDALIDKLTAARNYNQGISTFEYTACAMIDLELHARADDGPVDIAQFERDFLKRVGMPAEIGLRHRPTHFQHLFDGGGYAAGYYAYMWAEVLDADGYAAFTEAGDVFDPALAAKLKTIYGAGDTRRPDGAPPRVSRARSGDRPLLASAASTSRIGAAKAWNGAGGGWRSGGSSGWCRRRAASASRRCAS